MAADAKQAKLSIDTRILSYFIIELNIARRHFTAYPAEHPLIASSLDKVLLILEQLLEFSSEITLAVARDALMVGYAILDRKNPVYQDFARTLFEHDIGTITFRKSLTREELQRFNKILTFSRDEIRRLGGIDQVIAESGLQNLLVKRISYSFFRTTEEDRITVTGPDVQGSGDPSLWENFAHGLLDGTLDPHGSHTSFVTGVEPEILAEMMNELDQRAELKDESYSQVIASFVGHLEEDSSGTFHREPIEKLSTFVSRLNPDLRRQFLNGAFATLDASPRVTEEILGGLPDEIILEALEDLNNRSTYVPPMIVTILQKLSKTTGGGKVTDAGRRATTRYDGGAGQKLRVLFNEDSLNDYVPDAYQETLRAISAADTLQVPDMEDLASLRETLQEHVVEQQICLMLQEILTAQPHDCPPDIVERNLLELGAYFLETGDFACLAELCRRIGQLCATGCGPALQEVGDFFTSTEFIETVLNGFSLWGKSKCFEIRLLIKQVGVPFVEPLIIRLAEESTLSIRRTYLDALFDLGESARDPAISHLNDTRWYLVRNMILVLRNLNDRSLMIHFRRLKNHPHPRVRGEILKTLLHFGDPEADRLLLQYMDGTDRELRISAIGLAEFSNSSAVFGKLLELMTKRGVAGLDADVKVLAIRTLAQIGNPAALPAVQQLLESQSRLRPSALQRIKAEAVRSLGSYPGDTAVDLLRGIAGSDHAELAQLALETLKNMQGRR